MTDLFNEARGPEHLLNIDLIRPKELLNERTLFSVVLLTVKTIVLYSRLHESAAVQAAREASR